MLAIFICASAASDMLGKKVMKSLYSLSAWVMAAAPPSAYHESPMASLARATYSESGYVLIRVCRLSRATSYLLCFIASMARSNSTLSGCFELTLAIGFWTFLLLHPKVSSIAAIETAMMTRRNILNTSGKYCVHAGMTRRATGWPPGPPLAAPPPYAPDRRGQRRDFRQRKFLLRRGPMVQSLPGLCRHRFRCGNSGPWQCAWLPAYGPSPGSRE